MAEPKKDFSNFSHLYRKKFSDIVGTKQLSNAQLFELVVAYFAWAEKNPLNTPETANFQGRVYQGEAKKIRPFTLTSLCLFVGVTAMTWREWKKDDSDEERQTVIAFAESIIREQKYTAAMVGAFNPQFVLKDLDMDNSTVKNIGDPHNPIRHHHEHEQTVTLDQSAIDKILSKL